MATGWHIPVGTSTQKGSGFSGNTQQFRLARSRLTSLLRSLPVDKKTSLFKLLGPYGLMGILWEVPRASLERQFYLPWFSVDQPGSHTTKHGRH